MKIPYFKWREGRPRWEPGPGLRSKGFKGRDLKSESGEWLGYGNAADAAIALNLEVAAWRETGGKSVRTPHQRKNPRSCEKLYDNWIATPEFQMLRASTKLDYHSKARAFLGTVVDKKTGETFAEMPVAAISRKTLKNLWRELYKTRGHHMASGILRIVRIMMSHALNEEWVRASPAAKLGIKTAPARLALWLPHEVALFVATADEMGREGAPVADAVTLALHTGQRLSDVLAMPLKLFDETRVKLSQMKTRARIDAPMTPALLARVAVIKARQRGCGSASEAPLKERGNVVDLEAPLVQRPDGGGYDRHSFNKAFRAVRDRVAKKTENGELACPDIKARTFSDLRDTAVTRLASADCNMAEIASITGHDLQSITQIMKHYLALQPAMADAAIAKLTAWMSQEGIAI